MGMENGRTGMENQLDTSIFSSENPPKRCNIHIFWWETYETMI